MLVLFSINRIHPPPISFIFEVVKEIPFTIQAWSLSSSRWKRWHICCAKNHNFKCPYSIIRAKKGEFFLSDYLTDIWLYPCQASMEIFHMIDEPVITTVIAPLYGGMGYSKDLSIVFSLWYETHIIHMKPFISVICCWWGFGDKTISMPHRQKNILIHSWLIIDLVCLTMIYYSQGP